jgi:hypothetical protein
MPETAVSSAGSKSAGNGGLDSPGVPRPSFRPRPRRERRRLRAAPPVAPLAPEGIASFPGVGLLPFPLAWPSDPVPPVRRLRRRRLRGVRLSGVIRTQSMPNELGHLRVPGTDDTGRRVTSQRPAGCKSKIVARGADVVCENLPANASRVFSRTFPRPSPPPRQPVLARERPVARVSPDASASPRAVRLPVDPLGSGATGIVSRWMFAAEAPSSGMRALTWCAARVRGPRRISCFGDCDWHPSSRCARIVH